MASTVTRAFDELEAKLRPTDNQRTTIEARRKVTAGYLSDSFGSSSGMRLLSTKVIGSAGRDTIIRPIDDIDVLAGFQGAQLSNYPSGSRTILYRVCAARSQYPQ